MRWALFRISRGVQRRAFASSSSSSGSGIPIIDMGLPRDEAVRQLGRACEEIGFFSIVNHQVPKEVMDNMWRETWNYFDLPVEEKKKIPQTEEYPYGYCGFQEENLSAGYSKEDSKPDPKECFAIGPHNPAALSPPIKWPARPLQFKPAWQAYWNHMEGLSNRILSLLALALKLPANWFEDKVLRHRSALRALSYPEVNPAPKAGEIRAGQHTDYGTITILKQDEVGGLQVRRDGRSDPWVNVPYMPDAFVVNLGDLMPRWTNDKWVSTLHRVVTTDQNKRRQSVAFFHNIDHDHLVECIPTCQSPTNPPKYKPILFWDHLMEKHLASNAGTKKN